MGLRLVREIEQGETTMRMDKVIKYSHCLEQSLPRILNKTKMDKIAEILYDGELAARLSETDDGHVFAI